MIGKCTIRPQVWVRQVEGWAEDLLAQSGGEQGDLGAKLLDGPGVDGPGNGPLTS